MILIFDLDDTLYDERTYVDSGLRAVAAYGQARFGWEAENSYRVMQEVLDREGRGRIFDLWLAQNGRQGRKLVQECVRVYRHHTPVLTLAPAAQRLLEGLGQSRALYIVTDGHKIVQQKKIEALGIAPLFRKVMITHRYGVRHAKPSTHCFELIRIRENCNWTDMLYVGDNPSKDFVNLNRLGMATVRVLTGGHRQAEAKPGYEASHRIADLDELPALVWRLEAQVN